MFVDVGQHVIGVAAVVARQVHKTRCVQELLEPHERDAGLPEFRLVLHTRHPGAVSVDHDTVAKAPGLLEEFLRREDWNLHRPERELSRRIVDQRPHVEARGGGHDLLHRTQMFAKGRGAQAEQDDAFGLAISDKPRIRGKERMTVLRASLDDIHQQGFCLANAFCGGIVYSGNVCSGGGDGGHCAVSSGSQPSRGEAYRTVS